MNFRNISEGGGVISVLKNFIAIFLVPKRQFWSGIFGEKKLYNLQKFNCKFSADAIDLRKNSQYIFQKRDRGVAVGVGDVQFS